MINRISTQLNSSKAIGSKAAISNNKSQRLQDLKKNIENNIKLHPDTTIAMAVISGLVIGWWTKR